MVSCVSPRFRQLVTGHFAVVNAGKLVVVQRGDGGAEKSTEIAEPKDCVIEPNYIIETQ